MTGTGGALMTGRKGQRQPKGHTWVFSHEVYQSTRDGIQVVRVEKCVTPRHKHSPRQVLVRTIPRV